MKGSWPPLRDALQVDGNVKEANVTGLLPFAVYTFRVISVNELGRSEPSEPSYPVHTLRGREYPAHTLRGRECNRSTRSEDVSIASPRAQRA